MRRFFIVKNAKVGYFYVQMTVRGGRYRRKKAGGRRWTPNISGKARKNAKICCANRK